MAQPNFSGLAAGGNFGGFLVKELCYFYWPSYLGCLKEIVWEKIF